MYNLLNIELIYRIKIIKKILKIIYIKNKVFIILVI